MFPTRVSLYGGGSFLIPYFIFVALIGFTGVIGEMSFGRGTRSGPIDAFGMACETRGQTKAGRNTGLDTGDRCTGHGYRLYRCYGMDLPIYARSLYRLHPGTGRY